MNFGEHIWCVLSEKRKKWQKIQNLKFHNSLDTFGRDFLVRKIFGSESDVWAPYFSGDSFEIFSTIWSHVNEKEK